MMSSKALALPVRDQLNLGMISVVGHWLLVSRKGMIKAIYEFFFATLIVFAFLSLFCFRGFPPLESSSLPSGELIGFSGAIHES